MMRNLSLSASVTASALALGIFAAGVSAGALSTQKKEHGRLSRELAQALGWQEAKERLQPIFERVFPAGLPSASSTWAIGRFEEAVHQTGVRVEHFEPRSEEGPLTLDAAVQGSSPQVVQFLQRLPWALPGLALEELRLKASEGTMDCQVALHALFPEGEKGL